MDINNYYHISNDPFYNPVSGGFTWGNSYGEFSSHIIPSHPNPASSAAFFNPSPFRPDPLSPSPIGDQIMLQINPYTYYNPSPPLIHPFNFGPFG